MNNALTGAEAIGSLMLKEENTRAGAKPIFALQGSAKRWSPGCVNAAGKARQKW